MGNLQDVRPYKVRGANEWMERFSKVHRKFVTSKFV